MNIRISELRKIIRDVLKEQGWVPGRWNPTSGEEMSDDDISCMGSDGLGCDEDEEYSIED